MLQGELGGKKIISMDVQGAFPEASGERVNLLWVKEQASWGEYKVVRMCRGKIRKLELSLVIGVKENESLYKYLNSKRRARRISILYWM